MCWHLSLRCTGVVVAAPYRLHPPVEHWKSIIRSKWAASTGVGTLGHHCPPLSLNVCDCLFHSSIASDCVETWDCYSQRTHMSRAGDCHALRAGECHAHRAGEHHAHRAGECHAHRAGECHTLSARECHAHSAREHHAHSTRDCHAQWQLVLPIPFISASYPTKVQ